MGPRGAKGNTALHIAVKLASVAMVKALLVFEADTAVRNEDGLTPWQLAKKKWDASGVMDVMKDREGVLFAMHAVGAEGAGTDPGMYVRARALYRYFGSFMELFQERHFLSLQFSTKAEKS